MTQCYYAQSGYHPERNGIGWKATMPGFLDMPERGFEVKALTLDRLFEKAEAVYERYGYRSFALKDHHAGVWRTHGPEWHGSIDCPHKATMHVRVAAHSDAALYDGTRGADSRPLRPESTS